MSAGRRIASFVLAGALLPAFVQAAPGKRLDGPPPPCCVAPAPTQPDIRGTAQQPLAIEQPVAVEVTNFPPPPAPPLEPPKDRSGWVIAGATIALAVVTAILAFFTYRLWKSTGALVAENRATAERELRAYVFVESPHIEHVEADAQPVAHVPFKNSGRTPAYNVRSIVAVGIGDNDAVLPDTRDPEKPFGHLAPGGVFTAVSMLQRSLTLQELTLLNTGKRSLYVHGVIHYIDAFGKTHWTKFQVMVGGVAGLRASFTGGGLALVSSESGNQTDDEIGTLARQ